MTANGATPYQRSAAKNLQPATQARATHMIQIAAAGGLDEQTIEGNKLLSGGTVIYKQKRITQDEKAIITTETEKPAYQIRILDLNTGEFEEYDSRQTETYNEFLKAHTQLLLDAVNEANPPRYRQDYSPFIGHFNSFHSPRVIPGVADGLLTAQKHTVAALVTGLAENPAMILVGEMGTGKTMVSICAMAAERLAHGDDKFKIVVLAPAGVTPKWCQEIEKILSEYGVKAFLIGKERKQAHTVLHRPASLKQALTNLDYIGQRIENPLATDVQVTAPALHYRENGQPTDKVKVPACTGEWPKPKTRHVKIRKPILDTIEAMNYDGPAFLVMSYEIAKNGSEWEHAVNSRRRTVKWNEVVKEKCRWTGQPTEKIIPHNEEVDLYQCPTCGADLINEKDEGRPWNAKEELQPRRGKKRKMQSCPFCKAKLWHLVPFRKGGRWPVAEFLSQHYGGQYNFILDEAHNTKGGSTDIGQAMQDLASGAAKIIAMTGTLYNGYASSLFYLYYRTIPQFRQMYQHDEEQIFVGHHGLTETITRVSKNARTSAYGYGRNEHVRTKEAAGATPQMVRMMMPYTIFLTLDEIGLELPPKVELVIGVDTDESMKAGFKTLDDAEETAKRILVRTDGKAMGPHSRWFNAALGWPDNPIEEKLETATDQFLTISAAEMPEGGYGKDRELIKLIKGELNEGRGVGVFFQQVHRRNPMPRIQKLLKTEGIRSFILDRNTAKPEQRVPWLDGQVEASRQAGQEPVLLCNGNLVKEGLDLLYLPTLVCFAQEYNIMNLSQMLRRSWRLGQDRKVKIYFLYWKDTLQEKATAQIAAKLRAAGQVNGEIANGIAAFNMDDDAFMQDLMKAAKEIGGGKLARIMQTAVIEDVEFRPVLAMPAEGPSKKNGATRASGSAALVFGSVKVKPKKLSVAVPTSLFDGKPLQQLSLGI